MWSIRKKEDERVCLRVTDRDAITPHQLCEGVLAMGGVGSGKTTTLRHLMARIMRMNAGMLILTAKSTDMDDVLSVARKEGREKDVIELSPGKGHCFDPFSYEVNCKGGSIQALSQLLTDTVDFLTKTSSQQSHEPVFGLTSARQLRMLATILYHTTGQCDVVDLYQMGNSMATSQADVSGTNPDGSVNEWKKNSFCARMARHAIDLGATPDVEVALEFVLREWIRLSDKTASSVNIYTINLLERFISGHVRDLVSGASTVTPDDVLNGRILVINTPFLVYREPGQLIQLAWKLSMIRAALRRDLKANDRPVCIWADEAQLHALPSVDCMTQAVARSHKLINVAITQNIPLLESVIKRREDVLAWISNLQTKFIFANSDKDTNEYFSALFGHSKHLFGSTSTTTAPFDLVSDWCGQGNQCNVSVSEHWHPDVPPSFFGSGMRKGGAENNYVVDFYLYQAGRRFSNRKPWIKAALKQSF